MRLMNVTRNIALSEHVEIADSLQSRIVGLLGREELAHGHTLWIHRCWSIHTWFMQFPIDAVFVDKNLKVVVCHSHIAPFSFRSSWPWLADSVFEFAAGSVVCPIQVQKGDQLHVRT